MLKCLALKSPVLASTRASSSSIGTLSERCTIRSGASAKGTSQGFCSQMNATPTPSAASTSSVESPWELKMPVSRSEQRRISAIIGADRSA